MFYAVLGTVCPQLLCGGHPDFKRDEGQQTFGMFMLLGELSTEPTKPTIEKLKSDHKSA